MEPKRENFSRKRAAILSALRESRAHPTAEWVYRRLKPEYPDLSRGTVYRNLKLFQQTGQAASLGVVDGYERFDGDTAPHAHLVCTRCGAVVDVPHALPEPAELEDLSRETGCQINAASLRFSGLCPACAGEKEQEDGTEKDHL